MKDPSWLVAARINKSRIAAAFKPEEVWCAWDGAPAGERALGVVEDVPNGWSEKANKGKMELT